MCLLPKALYLEFWIPLIRVINWNFKSGMFLDSPIIWEWIELDVLKLDPPEERGQNTGIF